MKGNILSTASTECKQQSKEGLQDRVERQSCFEKNPHSTLKKKREGWAEERCSVKRQRGKIVYSWCQHPTATTDYVQTQQSEIRLCREHYSAEQLLAQLNGSKVFTCELPGQVFWQTLASPESCVLATFLTPFGRHHFNVLPFGKSSRPEHL